MVHEVPAFKEAVMAEHLIEIDGLTKVYKMGEVIVHALSGVSVRIAL